MSQETGIQRFALPKWEARAAAGGLAIGMFIAALVQQISTATGGFPDWVLIVAIGMVGLGLGIAVVRRRIVYSMVMLGVIVLYVAGAGVL